MNIAPQRIDGHPNLRTTPHQHLLNRADFNKKFLDPENAAGLQGSDVWRLLKGSERRYTYHPRGTEWGRSCDRVDLAVAGGSLVGHEHRARKAPHDGRGRETVRLLAQGAIAGTDIYDTELDRGHSDHVPLSVSLDVDNL